MYKCLKQCVTKFSYFICMKVFYGGQNLVTNLVIVSIKKKKKKNLVVI